MSTPQPGSQLPATTYPVSRADLVRYAGASGDFNTIHFSDRAADALGLPGVIAHGMLTMALAGRYVTAWAQDPTRVVSFSTRFSRPLVVPDDVEGTSVTVRGTVRSVDDGLATVALEVTDPEGSKLLIGAKAVVRLA